MMHVTIRAASDAIPPTSIHYQAGFIVLSYVISLIGCASALELLHRRTSRRGALNWYLLIAASIAMGGIGIWSMHFVGNRALVLGDGSAGKQLLYSQGYTALSFFLPIMVLVIAFYILALSGKAAKIYILVAGFLTGTAVCAMHYVGQVGIANYDCSYQIGNIVGAAVIAVAASLIALSVFFRLRESWTDSWWKRGLCAALLAGAVSGMHWTAAVGTVYRLRPQERGRGSHTRVQTVIFCAVLSIAACVLLLAIAFISRRRSKHHRRRAQELVLACVYFDEDDRVMVTNDGFLPYQKITNQFVRKTFGEDELSRSHPAFMWVYEASRNWAILRDLLPGLQTQLDADPVARKYRPDHANSIDLSRTASSDFDTIFKQLFCVAAERLADQIHEPMENLGVMFEEPLETGTTKSNRAIQNRLTGLDLVEKEKGITSKPFGRGRYFFLNRRLNRNEAADFAALGYRFGSIFHVADSLARNMQVSHDSMLSRLERMKICISREHLHPPGIHLACFLLRPNMHSGFDILVPSVAQNQLPMMTLPITEITPSHDEILQSIDEWTVRDILKQLVPEEAKRVGQAKDFKWQLYSAFVRLVDMVNDPNTMMEARFSAKPIRAPCRSSEASDDACRCTLLSVRYLGSIHSSYSQKELTYVPLDFFGAQQLVESSVVRHQIFKRKTQLEFGVDYSQRRKQEDIVPTMPRDTLQIEESKISPSSSPWSSRGLLGKIGFKRTKVSRQSSQSRLNPGFPSGRSTAEPDTSDSSPITKKATNVSSEEVHQMRPVEPSSPTPAQRYQGTEKASDEIQLITVNDERNSFVSELFALFRLSTLSEKGRIQGFS